MEPATCHRGAAAQDEKKHVRSVSLPNGALRKHHHHHRAAEPPGAPAEGVYRECMKNHAASLGGHALDGCGEFMPSPTADPAVPSSLVCAACGCHRNFHRRLLRRADAGDEEEHDNDNDEEEDDELEDEEEEGLRRSPAYSSAPHTLLALSHGLPGSMLPTGGGPPPASVSASVLPRKRFRTKFTAEQKGRMQELSERLGWRMQKRDDGVVEERCREIGVSKGVFKVWMHNNKHTFLGTASSRRKEMLAGGGGAKGGGEAAAAAANENNGGIATGNEGSKESSYVVNGSSSSS